MATGFGAQPSSHQAESRPRPGGENDFPAHDRIGGLDQAEMGWVFAQIRVTGAEPWFGPAPVKAIVS
jgi:hypothetical protein